jgi:energy-coupling factor transporter ATP-binding protein EcfA2
VLGREPFNDRTALMNDACFIADVAVLPGWLRVDQAIDFVAGVHPRFRRDHARHLLAKTQITGKRRMRELSKGMKTQVHLALTMAIDAKLLVLDEPTLGLDILARRAFYDALVNDYMDDTRTILITTHQVEEVENLLTDLIFIDQGRIASACRWTTSPRVTRRSPSPKIRSRRLARSSPSMSDARWARRLLLRAAGLRQTRGFRRGDDAQRFRFVRRQAVRERRMNTYIGWCAGNSGRTGRFGSCRLSLGGLLTLATLFGRVNIDGLTTHVAPATAEQGTVVGGLILFIFGIVFFAMAYVYASWYLLDCLYADRKDRSILFWKSLPISDTQTVLAKLFTGLIAIPLVYFIAADVADPIDGGHRFPAIASIHWQPPCGIPTSGCSCKYLAVPDRHHGHLVPSFRRLADAGVGVGQESCHSVVHTAPVTVFMVERWFFGTTCSVSWSTSGSSVIPPRPFSSQTRLLGDRVHRR